MKRPILLTILDGYGIGRNDETNAIFCAKTPVLDKMFSEFPNTMIQASGLAVGLPEGQMGNSEVGHMNIGAGRVVYQNLTKITKSIKDGDFYDNKALVDAFKFAMKNNGSVHVVGLLSDGGVHSHIDHFLATVDFAKTRTEFKDVVVWSHAIMDGRDTAPFSGVEFISQLDQKTVATVSGRYYAMDRDKNFDRNNKYLSALFGFAQEFSNPTEYIKSEHGAKRSDEFIIPAKNETFGGVKENDAIIIINFRPDRAMQIAATLTNGEYENKFAVPSNIYVTTMTKYSNDVIAPVAFPPEKFKNTLGEFLSSKNYKQLRIAETEKYAHVTFFMDGGEDLEINGATRALIKSPKVATYDMQPEMSLPEITEKLLEEIEKDIYDVIILNYANCDMVGHTGNFDATIKAVEAVDGAIGKLFSKFVEEKNGIMLITADHGNADQMLSDTGDVITAHSTNMVPFLVAMHDVELAQSGTKALCDVAPTIIKLLGEEIPAEMTGKSIIK